MNLRIKYPFSALILLALLSVVISGSGNMPVEAEAQAPGPLVNYAAYDWLQFNGDSRHSGRNTREILISSGNVSQLAQLFQVTLLGVADGAPAVLVGVNTLGGVKDLVFLTTKDGHLQALDAHTGGQVWAKQNGPGSCKIK